MSFRRNAARVGLVAVTAAGLLFVAESGPRHGLQHAQAATGRTPASVPPTRTASFAYADTDLRQRVIATWHPGQRAAPWVATIHGGSWVKGRPADMQKAVNLFSRNGYQVFNIDYRLVDARSMDSTVRWSDQRADVQAALGWIRAHAARFGINAERGALYGSSAGGNLALAAGLAGDGTNGIRGIVSVAGVVQPTRLWDDVLHRNEGEQATPSMRRLARFAQHAVGCPYPRRTVPGDCPTRWRALDAYTSLSPHDPAVLLYQGLRDHTVPHQMARNFRRQLDRANIAGSLVLVPRLGHSQRVALDGRTRQAALLAFVKQRTSVERRPALSRLTVARRAGKTTRLVVRVYSRQAGVPVTGRVVATAGRVVVRARLTNGRTTLTLAAGKIQVRYEGSPRLQPGVALLER